MIIFYFKTLEWAVSRIKKIMEWKGLEKNSEHKESGKSVSWYSVLNMLVSSAKWLLHKAVYLVGHLQSMWNLENAN